MGTYTETDAVSRIWSRLRDYGSTTDQQLMNDTEITSIGIRGAEPIYSRVRPATKVADLTANGTNYLALPSGWVEGLSVIESIESPPDAVPPEVKDPRTYFVGRSTTAQRIVWLESAPANGATVRVAYTAPRVLAALAANTTVLDPDFTAFTDLAASLCADSIAAKYARTSEPAFNADAVNFRSRAAEWRDVAKSLWTAWERGIGLYSGGDGQDGGSNLPPASAYANWDARSSWGGWYINHPRLGR